MAVVKCQGIPKGGHIERIRRIRIVNVKREKLNDILSYPLTEIEREGFPGLLPDAFIKMFLAGYGLENRKVEVTRIEFEYID